MMSVVPYNNDASIWGISFLVALVSVTLLRLNSGRDDVGSS